MPLCILHSLQALPADLLRSQAELPQRRAAALAQCACACLLPLLPLLPLAASAAAAHGELPALPPAHGRCDKDECLDDPIVKRVYNRVANVTRVPADNFEYMQMLRYLPCEYAGHPDCQFYKRHHDTIPELTTMQPGPRVYTFFLYLSDVEEGGGTKFDGGFTVQPGKGKAVFWPATLEETPFVSDDRTHHEALPVLKGIKYAANFWLHQHDYVTPHKKGCTT